MKFIMYLVLPILFLGCNDTNELEVVDVILSNQEIEDLQFLKEEEKLARDVYLYDLYGQNIFKNISNSEQSHMNSVTVILEKYGIEDLSLADRGKFSNTVLQSLYDDLTNLALESLDGALTAGATIEDLDINDINTFIGNTRFQDIGDMYALLNCGSKNHLRAYTNNLEGSGVFYVPQFLTIGEYNSIINSDNEKCNN